MSLMISASCQIVYRQDQSSSNFTLQLSPEIKGYLLRPCGKYVCNGYTKWSYTGTKIETFKEFQKACSQTILGKVIETVHDSPHPIRFLTCLNIEKGAYLDAPFCGAALREVDEHSEAIVAELEMQYDWIYSDAVEYVYEMSQLLRIAFDNGVLVFDIN